MNNTYTDPVILHIIATLKENERQKMSQRVKFGKKVCMEKGVVPSYVFGYDRVDKYTLVPHPVESKWVRKIFDLYTEGGWSLYKISQFLHKNRVFTKGKKKDGQPNYNWSPSSVKRILTNKLYLGLVINGRESTKNIYSNERIQNPEEDWYVVERPEFRLISDEQYEEAQKIMKEPRTQLQGVTCEEYSMLTTARRINRESFWKGGCILMKKYQKTVTVYELPDGFVAEVHRDKESTDFYIYHKAYGIKMLMFGLCNCDVETEEQALEANVEDYMDIYTEKYCDYTDAGDECFV